MTKLQYKQYLLSPYWQEVKRLVFMRDRFSCRFCGKKKLLQAHHTTYAHLAEEKKHLHEVITLCEKCHKAEHRKWKECKKDWKIIKQVRA